MDKNFFKFNDTSSADMGLVIEKLPRRTVPRKRVETYSIPGRSGDLHQWDGSYENYVQPYRCWFLSDPVAEQTHKIAEWLHNAPFGARLEDSHDEDVYHLASYIGGDDIESITSRLAKFTVNFDVAAPAYLTSGDRALNIATSGLLNNPTRHVSKPLIEVDINGKLGGVLRINDYSINLFFGGLPATTVYIDCDIREAWYLADGVEISCNQVVSSQNWPTIDPGTSNVSFSGLGIDAVRIYTRCWKL